MLSDLRYALRSLVKSPGFTVVALLTLSIGIGLNTAMFSLINSLLFRASPYPDADRLVRVYRTSSQSQTAPHSLPDLQDAQADNVVFTSFTAFQWWSCSLSEPDKPAELLSGLIASADIFSTLGVQPMLGRGFTREEQQPGRDRVVVLSQEFWQRHFGGDPEIIGRTLWIDAETVTVIGVMPSRASYPRLWGRLDIYRPITLTNDWRQNRGTHWLNAMARLKPGIPLSEAQAATATLAAQLAQEYPDVNAGSGLRIEPLHLSATQSTERQLSWFALGLSAFVLLIACANLANLQLARAAIHSRDLAIRTALGATRARLMRQQLTESMLLAVTGGALGLLLAIWVNGALNRQLWMGGEKEAIQLDFSVLSFAILASIATGLLFGVMPAWVAVRGDVNGALKQQSRGSTGDRSHHRLRHGLIVAEVALALLLLSGASFFIRGLQRFMQHDPGWKTSGLITGAITLPEKHYSVEQRRNFFRALTQRLTTLPGVEGVALASELPISDFFSANPIFVEGQPTPKLGQEPLAYFSVVTPSYFSTLQIPLLKGRIFPDDIGPDKPAYVVINETSARLLWPGQDPIGRRISNSMNRSYWFEVIGVVRDSGFAAYAGSSGHHMQIYRPLSQDAWAYVNIVLRASRPEAFADSLRRTVASLDQDLPVAYIRTVSRAIDDVQHNFYIINRLLAAFALFGLGLSALGLYGVITAFVTRRIPEFGIRLALGASPTSILHLVLNQGLRLTVYGILIGIVGSFFLVRILSAMLPGLPGQDYASFALNFVVLLIIAIVSCWLPARRATKVDPIEALRAE